MMIYTASKGVDRRLKGRLLRAFSALLPVFAVAFLALALFSSSIKHADGVAPNLPRKNPSVSAVRANSNTSVPANNPAALTSSSRPAQNNDSTASSNLNLAAPVPSASSGVSSTPSLQSTPSSAVNGNLLQTTVTIPPVSIQLDNKPVVSTGEIPLTVN